VPTLSFIFAFSVKHAIFFQKKILYLFTYIELEKTLYM